jgi:hypothetical protein
MLTDRLFRKLDRERLDAALLLTLAPRLEAALDDLVRAREAYVEQGAVRVMHVACQQLVDVLDASFDLPSKRVFMRDRPRPHKRRKGRVVYEVHGQCDPDGPMEIFTRTAAHARPVALKTLLDTLLHEWVHHYDFTRFGESVHCKGFYERLSQLYRPLRDRLDVLS